MTNGVATHPGPKMTGFVTGTGFYELPALSGASLERVETPYGPVEVTLGIWHGERAGFVPRHGASHSVSPSKINYRANLWALHQLGASRLITVCVVGSLREDLAPGGLLLVDQFLDLTKGRRADTFFDGGDEVRHTDMTYPYSETLRGLLLAAGEHEAIELVRTGTYACLEGPRFETAAEARMARILGGDVVGMTGYPEVALARELDMEICTVAVVSNFAPGVVGNTVSVREVVAETASASERLLRLLDTAVRMASE
ncbi:MAG: S-methyl-5'-thioinosine phosphorylase [Acidimicrobiales bacterium]